MKRSRAVLILGALLLVMGGALAISAIFDEEIIQLIAAMRTPLLSTALGIITSSAFLLITLYAIPLLFCLKKKRNMIFPLLASLALTTALIELMKQALARPRPSVEHLVSAGGYSFPSNHAAVAFAALPLLFIAFPKRRWIAAGIALLITFSRVYVGVHYLSDVLVGAIIGILIGECIVSFQMDDRYAEFRRQSFHMFFGSFLFLLIYLKYVDGMALAALLIVGVVLAIVASKRRIPVISWFLDKLDRKGGVPGRGAMTLVLGILLALLIFPREIAYVAIVAVVFLDAMTTLAGITFGSLKNPLNPKKTIEGSIIGFIVAFLWSLVFFPVGVALAAAAAAMVIESLEGGVFSLDDNITIPLVTGSVVWLLPHLA